MFEIWPSSWKWNSVPNCCPCTTNFIFDFEITNKTIFKGVKNIYLINYISNKVLRFFWWWWCLILLVFLFLPPPPVRTWSNLSFAIFFITFFDFFPLLLSESSSTDFASFGLFSIRADVAAVAAELIVSLSISLPSSDCRIFLPDEVAALKNVFQRVEL